MKTLDKFLNWTAWIFAGMGFLFVLLGLIQVLYGLVRSIFAGFPEGSGRLFGDTEVINFFIASSNFFIITIAAIIYKWHCKKE